MLGKKKKELQTKLAEREAENEQLKQRINELEAELNRLKEQESLVLRAITEANRTAERIEAEAGETHDKLIAEAEQHVRNAEEEAETLRRNAEEDAESVRKDADDYSDNIRTDANIYVERTIIASQLEVKKRKDVMAEMNELLKKTTDYLNEQTETFNAMLKTVIEESEEQANEICYEIEKCSCSCDECENPCMAHAGKPGASKEGDGDDEDEDESEEESDCAEPCEPAEEEAPAEEAPEAACADGENAPAGVDPDTLPDEYESPAQLMKNIYYIQQRDLPIREENEPVGIPHDDKLDEIVSDVVEAS